ncbi:MAG: hypothetical protein FJX75_20040, partial [Armatimonadetes bacterium]|nr:hypothetical protein [Armatimonadota bacterium]
MTHGPRGARPFRDLVRPVLCLWLLAILLALVAVANGFAAPLPDVTAKENCTQAERAITNGDYFNARQILCRVLLAGDRPDWTQAHLLLVRSYVDDTGPSRLTSEKTAAFQGDRAFGGYNVQCIPGAAAGWFFGRGLCNLELAKREKFYTEAAVKDFKVVYTACESKATRKQVPSEMLAEIAKLRAGNPELAAKLPAPPGPGVVSGVSGWVAGHWMILAGVVVLVVLFLMRRPILRMVTTGTGRIKASFVMRKCPHCSELVPRSATTCPKCSKEIAPPKPAPTPEPKPVTSAAEAAAATGDPTGVVRCPNCGMKSTRETLICTGCKFRLARTCTRCNQPVEYHKLKCPSCGHETEVAKYAKSDYSLTTIGAGG